MASIRARFAKRFTTRRRPAVGGDRAKIPISTLSSSSSTVNNSTEQASEGTSSMASTRSPPPLSTPPALLSVDCFSSPRATSPAGLVQVTPPVADSARGESRRHLLEAALGSDMKILKTTDITPMPDFRGMTDQQLKAELARFGVRPLGRRNAVALLTRIYNETHIEVPWSETPLKPTADATATSDSSTTPKRSEPNDVLNKSLDACLEESLLDADGGGELEDELETDPVRLKDLDSMQVALVAWFRLPENGDLHALTLSLQPIALEEISSRLARARGAASGIPRKHLMELLDRLHITFSLPAESWKRKRKHR